MVPREINAHAWTLLNKLREIICRRMQEKHLMKYLLSKQDYGRKKGEKGEIYNNIRDERKTQLVKMSNIIRSEEEKFRCWGA